MIRGYIITSLLWWPICYFWYRFGRSRGYDERQREVIKILEKHQS